MNYKELLEHSLKSERNRGGIPTKVERLGYLAQEIFKFTTYDPAMDKLFATKAVEVCEAITNRRTYKYLENPENYQWYLLMCNMPFFIDKLDWGGSIRGAWWSEPPSGPIKFGSTGLWVDDLQLVNDLHFSLGEWEKFMKAIVEFAAPEMKPIADKQAA